MTTLRPDEKYPQSSCAEKNKPEVGTNKCKEGINKVDGGETTSLRGYFQFFPYLRGPSGKLLLRKELIVTSWLGTMKPRNSTYFQSPKHRHSSTPHVLSNPTTGF